MSQSTYTEADLRADGWTYAGHEMMLCAKYPEAWDAWVRVGTGIDPSQTTDTKMAKRFADFVADYLRTRDLPVLSIEELRKAHREGALDQRLFQ